VDFLSRNRRHRATGGLPGPIRGVHLLQALIAVGVVLVFVVAYFEAHFENRSGARQSRAESAPSVVPTTEAPRFGASPSSSASFGLSSQPPSSTSGSQPVGPATVTARYVYSNVWDNGFIVRITLTNVAKAPQSWTVTMTVPAGVDLTSSWSSQSGQTGRTLEFTPEKKNTTLAPGESLVFGFQASHAGAYQLQSCLVNGRPCS
jgi:cytoskeletal protein RodZ